MRSKKMMAAILTAVILFVLILAGCSKSDAPKQGAADAGKAKLMEQIKKRGKVIVGTEAAYAPFEYVENGKIVGYGADILQAIVQDMGVELEQLDLPFQGLLPGLEAKKFDFIATSVIITPERAKKYSFTIPIAEGTSALLKRKGDAAIQTVGDINGKIVGTQLSSGSESALKAFNEKLKADGKAGVKEIKQYQAFPEAAMELKNARIDAVAQSLPALNLLMKSQPDTFEVVGGFGEKRYIAWVTRKEDEDVLAFLNEGILKLKRSGKLAELQKKWFGAATELPEKDYMPQ